MTDLVERLRESASWLDLQSRTFSELTGSVYREAADEIERLRAEVFRLIAETEVLRADIARSDREIETLRNPL